MIWISLPHNWKEINSFKGQTIRKFMKRGGGGWGTGEVQKNIFVQGKIKLKNSCTPVNTEKIFML